MRVATAHHGKTIAPALMPAADGAAHELHGRRRVRPIVIAEDNHELRRLLASALALVGYRVIGVATGTELVTTIARLEASGEPPQLVITDVRMPGLGGFEAALLLRDTGSRAPLIFMTAYGDVWSHRRAAALGATLLSKPLTITGFRAAVRDAVAAGQSVSR